MIFRCVTDEVGVLVIVMEGMIQDLQIFLEIFAYTIIGFSLAFVGLAPHGDNFWGDKDVDDLRPDDAIPSNAPWAPPTMLEEGDVGDDGVIGRMLRPSAGGDSSSGSGCLPALGPLTIFKTLSLPLWAVYGELSLPLLGTVPYSQPVMFM